MNHLDLLKDFIRTTLSIRQNEPDETELDDKNEYSISSDVKLEESFETHKARNLNNSGKKKLSFLYLIWSIIEHKKQFVIGKVDGWGDARGEW